MWGQGVPEIYRPGSQQLVRHDGLSRPFRGVVICHLGLYHNEIMFVKALCQREKLYPDSNLGLFYRKEALDHIPL